MIPSGQYTLIASFGLCRLGRAGLVCAMAAATAHSAWAGPGDHIRPSDSVTVIPTLDVGTEFRTNVYRSEYSDSAGAHLLITPGLSITAEGPDHRFGLSGHWDLRKYYYVGGGLLPAAVARLTPGERIRRLDRFDDFGVAGSIELFRASAVGLVLDNRATMRNTLTDYEYADQPFNAHFRNVLKGGVRLEPTSALSITPGVRYDFDDYRVAGFTERRYNVRSSFGPTLEARWHFLPRTALVMEGRYTAHRWGQNHVLANGHPTGMALPDSDHLLGRVRLEGQLTSRLHANLGLGFGGAWYDEATVGLEGPVQPHLDGPFDVDLTGLDGLLAIAQLRYLLSDDREIHAGYEKSFEDSFFTNFFTYHYLYAGADTRFGRLSPSVRYGVRLEEYQGVVERRDVFHRLSLSTGYELSQWATLDGGVGLQARESDQARVQYNDWIFHLKARFEY